MINAPTVGFHVCSMFCYALLYVLFSFSTILMEMGELVILLCLSSWCLGIVVFLLVFLMMPWVGLQRVIVVFPDHTHMFFLVDFLMVVQNMFNTQPVIYRALMQFWLGHLGIPRQTRPLCNSCDDNTVDLLHGG